MWLTGALFFLAVDLHWRRKPSWEDRPSAAYFALPTAILFAVAAIVAGVFR